MILNQKFSHFEEETPFPGTPPPPTSGAFRIMLRWPIFLWPLLLSQRGVRSCFPIFSYDQIYFLPCFNAPPLNYTMFQCPSSKLYATETDSPQRQTRHRDRLLNNSHNRCGVPVVTFSQLQLYIFTTTAQSLSHFFSIFYIFIII